MASTRGDIRLTLLSDNHGSKQGLGTEHGMSMLVEVDYRRVLFDTGQSDLFIDNARRLHRSLEPLDAVVLSHGHYDHTGGLHHLGPQRGGFTLYLHPEAMHRRYSRNHDDGVHEIGMPEASRRLVDPDTGPVKWTRDPTTILPGVWVTGEVLRSHAWEDTGGEFYRDHECTERDLLLDDQSLVIETDEGTVVVFGCCHAGVLNTLEAVRRRSGRPLRAVIGGMHLARASQQRLQKTADYLASTGCPFIASCHCTGESSIDYLRDHLPKVDMPEVGVGWTMTFG